MAEKAHAVERPRLDHTGCWALVRRYTGSLFSQYSHCGFHRRPGMLTCRKHDYLEASAQSLANAAERAKR